MGGHAPEGRTWARLSAGGQRGESAAPRLNGGLQSPGVAGQDVGPCGAPAGSAERPPSPCSWSQHQQQVLQTVERAKQVTMAELNSIVGVSRAARLVREGSVLLQSTCCADGGRSSVL